MQDRAKIRDNIAEEMADVYITMRQLMIIFDNSDNVQEQADAKIERLDKRIKEESWGVKIVIIAVKRVDNSPSVVSMVASAIIANTLRPQN